jgi:pimeloyl-ACP methyl ester carboxylesterase
MIREVNHGSGIPLLCLHATAYSSRSFLPLMSAFGDRRHVFAVDLPGYGESDGPDSPVPIPGYSSAIAEVLPDGAVDLFGYHTGVVVATELAIQHPESIRSLTLLGVPYFRALDFQAWKTRLAKPHELRDDLAQFQERWQWLVTDRPVGMSLERGFGNFVDELKAWPDGYWAHQALFEYDCEAQFAKVEQPVRILNPESHLAEASRMATALFPQAECVELPAMSGAVLETCADEFVELIAGDDGS